jgi:hypothetical protein
LADVRVIERRDRVRFFLKPIAARAGKTLDCNDAIEASVESFVHLAL